MKNVILGGLAGILVSIGPIMNATNIGNPETGNKISTHCYEIGSEVAAYDVTEKFTRDDFTKEGSEVAAYDVTEKLLEGFTKEGTDFGNAGIGIYLACHDVDYDKPCKFNPGDYIDPEDRKTYQKNKKKNQAKPLPYRPPKSKPKKKDFDPKNKYL